MRPVLTILALLLALVTALAGCATGEPAQGWPRRIDGVTAQAVTPGMTPEQVLRLLGPPRTRMFFRNSGEDVWDWDMTPDMAASYPLRLNVHFKDGVVLKASQSMVFPSRMFPFGD